MAGGGKVEQLELAFMLNAQSVEAAGKSLRTEVEKGLGQVSFDAIRRNADSAAKDIGKTFSQAVKVELQIDTKGVDKALGEYQDKRVAVERKAAVEGAKAGAEGTKREQALQSSKSKGIMSLFREEKKLGALRMKGMKRLNKEADKFLSTLKKTQKYMPKGGKFSVGKGKGGTPGGGKGMFGDIANMLGLGKKGGGGGMMGGAAKSGGKAVAGGAARAGAGAAASGGGAMAAMGSAAAALGPIAVALGAIAAVIGVVVGAFILIAKLLMDAEGQAKDFNKSILQGAGGADLMAEGFDGVTGSLDAIRKSAINNQFRFKALAKDQIEILKTLHEQGATYREITKGIMQGKEAQESYAAATGLVLQTSRMIGESAQTVATNMANISEDLGMTLEGVAKRFSTVSKMAMESGFSTKRFFSMVIQATSGMSMYNVRLEEAAGLLVRIGKILGQKTGGEFLQTLNKGFAGESMTQRFKRVKLTGESRTQKHMDRSATDKAASLQNKFIENMKTSTGRRADTSGLLAKVSGGKLEGDIGKMSTEALRKELSKLKGDDVKKFLAAYTAEISKTNAGAADGMRRDMASLIDLNKGAKGGLLNMAANLGELDMGGKLNMLKDSMKTMFPGKEIHELSALQLAALENATGMQGEELHTMRKLTQGLDGNFSHLADVQKKLTKESIGVDEDGNKLFRQQSKEDRIASVKQFGAYMDEYGDIVAASVNEKGKIEKSFRRGAGGKKEKVVIENFDEYIQSQGKRLDSMQKAKNFNEDRAIANEIAANTWSIKDMIAAGIVVILEKIYGAVQAIYGLWSSDTQSSALAAQGGYYDNAGKSIEQSGQLEMQIADMEKKYSGEADHTKASEIKEQIKILKLIKQQADVDSKVFMKMGDTVFKNGKVNEAWDPDQLGGYESSMGKFADVLPFIGKGGSNSTREWSKVSSTLQADIGDGSGVNYGTRRSTQIDNLFKDDPEFAEEIKSMAPDMVAQILKWNEGSAKMTAADTKRAMGMKAKLVEGADIASSPNISRENDDSRFSGGKNAVDHVGGTAHTGQTGVMVDGVELSPIGLTKAVGGVGNRPEPGGTVKGRAEAGSIGTSSMVGLGIKDEHSGIIADVAGAPDVDANKAGGAAARKGIFAAERTLVHANDSDAPWQTQFNMGEQSTTANMTVTAPSPSATTADYFVQKYEGEEGGAKQYLENAGLLRDSGMDLVGSVPTVTAANTVSDVGSALGRTDQTRAGLDRGSHQAAPASNVVGGVAQSTSVKDAALGTGGPENVLGMGLGAKQAGSQSKDAIKLLEDLKDVGLTEDQIAESLEATAKANPGKLFSYDDWMKYLNQAHPAQMTKIDDAKKLSVKQERHLRDIQKLLAEDKDKTFGASERKEGIGAISGVMGLSATQAKELEDEDLSDPTKALFAKLKTDATGGDAMAIAQWMEVSKVLGRSGLLEATGLQDFIYQGGSGGGVIRAIHGKDSFLAMKPKGPIDNAMGGGGGGGGGGTVNINVYSEVDLIKVQQAIYSAMRKTGVGGSKKSWAGSGNFGNPMKKF